MKTLCCKCNNEFEYDEGKLLMLFEFWYNSGNLLQCMKIGNKYNPLPICTHFLDRQNRYEITSKSTKEILARMEKDGEYKKYYFCIYCGERYLLENGKGRMLVTLEKYTGEAKFFWFGYPVAKIPNVGDIIGDSNVSLNSCRVKKVINENGRFKIILEDV